MELRGRPKGEKNRHHTKDFKLEVVKRVLAGEGSKTLAREYDLSRGLVSRWVVIFREKGEAGPRPRWNLLN